MVAEVPVSGNKILIDPENPNAKERSVRENSARDALLASWVMARVKRWREYRDSKYREKWDEYTRLWRGKWSPKDKTKGSERSRLINPGLQQAIDMTVAEMEEATFGKGVWFDISDDVADQEKGDALLARDQLLEDFEFSKVKSSIAQIYLLGALYGTGIGKIHVGEIKEYVVENRSGTPSLSSKSRVTVELEPIRPDQFVIDIAARSVDEALGMAHEVLRPRHTILERQREGIYQNVDVGNFTGSAVLGSSGEQDGTVDDTVFVTEYHGLVPRFLMEEQEDDSEILPTNRNDNTDTDLIDIEDDELVEAIVTIANEGLLLRKVLNPFLKDDRSFIAYQHDTVPGQFWGRGVSEKGWNAQKALDAELRARIDYLGYITAPLIGADTTKIPRGMDLSIKPGKLFLTHGNPTDAIAAIQLGANLTPDRFQHSGDLERMISMATGAMDSAIPLNKTRRNETASGMSMMQSGFIKRSKRTMNNVEEQLLDPLIQKSFIRYVQFAPDVYRFNDVKFSVHSTMGIMAREFEQAQMSQLLQIVPPESPMFGLIIKSILENGALPDKNNLMRSVDQFLTPDPEEQQRKKEIQRLQLENAKLENDKLRAEVEEIEGKGILAQAKAVAEIAGIEQDDEQLDIQAANINLALDKNRIQELAILVQALKVMQEGKKDKGDK